jgi:hypothetical protein
MEKFTKYLKSSAFNNKEYYPIPSKLKKEKFSIFKKKNLH